ncbi:hypothetical protein ACTA71_012211 [Dictyostelium dimigraforme]
MNSTKLFCIVLSILFFTGNVISLSNLEYQCTFNFLNKISNVSQFYYDPTSVHYDFCNGALSPLNTLVTCNEQSVANIRVTQTKNNLITPSDIQCFSSIITLIVDGFKVSKNFLLGPFPESLYSVSLINGNASVFNVDTGVGKSISIPKLIVRVYLSGPLNIYFSSLLNVQSFYLTTQTLQPKFKINYINDLGGSSTSFDSFISYTHSIPSLNNIQMGLLQLTLLPGTDLNSFSSFSTFGNVSAFSLTSSNNAVYPFPTALSSIPVGSNENTGFTINYQIDAPHELINLSNYNESLAVSISLPNVGNLFNVNGEFPFSALPPNLVLFELNNGEIDDINLNQLFNKEYNLISLGNNNMGGIFPTSFPSNLLSNDISLYVNDNKLTGQIDESWCSSDLDISNNLISGQAPSCVVCNYLQPYTNSHFGGNQFSNLNIENLEECTTLELNLSYDDITDSLFLYGKDLGFTIQSFTLDNPKKWAKSVITINKNFQIKKSLSSTGPIAKGFNITFPYLPQGPRTFEITAYNQFNPQINSVTENSNVFTISGKYFAYNCDVINVSISGETCVVSSCNFNQIQCQINNQIQSTSVGSIATAFVKVMDVSSTFDFSFY